MSESLGRGSELVGENTALDGLLGLHTNPILGTGFESFWLGERPKAAGRNFLLYPKPGP